MSDVNTRALCARLASEDRTERKRACDEAVSLLATEPGLRHDLNGLLLDGTLHARFAAAWVLFQTAGPSLRLLPALLQALDASDGDVRWSATHMLAALARMQGEAREVLLHEARGADSPLRRRMALYAVREVAPERPETEAAILAGLDDPDPDVRRAALSSIAKLTEPGTDSLQRALHALGAPDDPRQRRIAAVLLPDLVRHHPERAGETRRALENARASDDPTLGRAVEAALARLEPPQR